jgi:hypothetical protein
VPLVEQALSIAEKALGPEHPTTVTIRRNLQAARDMAAKRREPGCG